MKIFKKLVKWITRIIALLVIIVLVSGLIVRIFSNKPEPIGNLVDVNGSDLHIIVEGEKNNKPTLVIEGGSGIASLYFHWLSEGLKDSMRVVRYDRAGIGYSEKSKTPRTAENIAHELHTLLEKSGEEPPYIMMGHSMGGPYVRVFTELYPDEVAGMFLLDSTHPDRVARVSSIPKPSSLKFKTMVAIYKIQGVLADLGVLKVYDQLMGPILHREMDGLPKEINDRSTDFLYNGKYIRTMGKEFGQYHNTLQRAGEKDDFGTLPVRIFTDAISDIPDEVYEKYLKRGVDLRGTQIKSMEMQKELTELSSNSKLTILEGTHTSIFTKKENADMICKEVLNLLGEIDYF